MSQEDEQKGVKSPGRKIGKRGEEGRRGGREEGRRGGSARHDGRSCRGSFDRRVLKQCWQGKRAIEGNVRKREPPRLKLQSGGVERAIEVKVPYHETSLKSCPCFSSGVTSFVTVLPPSLVKSLLIPLII